MSLRDLTEHTGLSMGALYAYFDSKDTLLMMILGQVVVAVEEVLTRPPPGLEADPAARLRWLLETHLYLTETMQPWFVFAYMEAKAFPREGRDLAVASELTTERLMAEALEEGARAGLFRVTDVEMTAALIKPLLQDWYVKRAKYHRRGITPERYAQSVIDFVEAAHPPLALSLQPGDEDIGCSADMLTRQRFGGVPIALADGIQNTGMLVPEGTGYAVAFTQHLTHHPPQIVPVRLGRLRDQRIAGKLVQEAVEPGVHLDLLCHGPALYRLPALRDDRGTVDPGTRRAILRRHAACQPLQHRTDFIEVAGMFLVQCRHDEAAPGSVVDEAMAAQKQQGLLHRLPRHPISFGQFVLDQPRVRRQLPFRDLGQDRVIDLLDKPGLGSESAHGFLKLISRREKPSGNFHVIVTN